jgi:AcrR family transcriptional regulator
MSADAPSARRDEAPAQDRILEAAGRRIVASGAAALSLSEVADEAGVSKALIHYHFHDKDTMLVRLLERVASDISRRESHALDDQHTALAVDALWSWLLDELRRGDLRVLLEVSQYRSAPVQAAARDAAEQRRRTTTETIARLFAILGLQPRVPADLVAEVVVAFVDGLALDVSLRDERSTRIAFDVLWLALLNLAE